MPREKKTPPREPQPVLPKAVVDPGHVDPPGMIDYKKPPVPFTFERRMRFLYALREHGRIFEAAAIAGITSSTVSRARREEKEFDEAVEEARNQYIDCVLLKEATRRAVEGVMKPIIGGRFKDEIVAYEQVYSDGLLKMLICAARAEFRDGAGSGLGKYNQLGGGVIVVPAAPVSIEAWQESLGALARPKDTEEPPGDGTQAPSKVVRR